MGREEQSNMFIDFFSEGKSSNQCVLCLCSLVHSDFTLTQNFNPGFQRVGDSCVNLLQR